MITVKDVIFAAGGHQKIADAVNGQAHLKDISEMAVKKWPQRGIPEYTWSVIIKLCKNLIDANGLHEVNEALRKAKK